MQRGKKKDYIQPGRVSNRDFGLLIRHYVKTSDSLTSNILNLHIQSKIDVLSKSTWRCIQTHKVRKSSLSLPFVLPLHVLVELLPQTGPGYLQVQIKAPAECKRSYVTSAVCWSNQTLEFKVHKHLLPGFSLSSAAEALKLEIIGLMAASDRGSSRWKLREMYRPP